MDKTFGPAVVVVVLATAAAAADAATDEATSWILRVTVIDTYPVVIYLKRRDRVQVEYAMF